MIAKVESLLPAIAVAGISLAFPMYSTGAPVPVNYSTSDELLRARRTSAERFAMRIFADYALMAPRSKGSSERIGSALRHLFDADLACAETAAERLIAAERYNRLVHRLWRAEKHFGDTGHIADSNFQPRAVYFARDAAIQVLRAQRAAGPNRQRVSDRADWVEPDLTAKTLAIDVLTVIIQTPRWLARSARLQEKDVVVPFTPELARALEPFPGVLGPQSDDELARLIASRCETAAVNLAMDCKVFQAGPLGSSLDRLFENLNRRLRSELEFRQKPSDQLKAQERALTIAKWIEQVNERRFKAGQIAEPDLELSRFHRLDDQIGMLKAKSRVEGESKKPAAGRK